MGYPSKVTSQEKEKRDLMAKTINTIIMTCYGKENPLTDSDLIFIPASATTLVDAIFAKYPDKTPQPYSAPITNAAAKKFLDL